jgi:hypothetical protein
MAQQFSKCSGVPKNFFPEGGVQQIQLRTEDRENGVWGRYFPSHGFCSICKCVNPVFILVCYGCIFHGTGNLAHLCESFGISGEVGCRTTPRYTTE